MRDRLGTLASAAAVAMLLSTPSSARPAIPGHGLQSPTIGELTLEAEWGDGIDPPLDHPMAVTLDPDGTLLVADSGNGRVVRFDSAGNLLSSWSLPEGSRPVGLVARQDGTTLVADYVGDRILVLGPGGAIDAEWGGTGEEPGRFEAPSGLALTPAGTVVVVEFLGQRVQELDAQGGFLRFLDGGEAGAVHARERPPVPGMEEMAEAERVPVPGNPHGLYVFPSDAAVAADGTVYVSNTHAYEIVVLEPDGTLRDAWGRKGAAAGQWEVPVGLAVGPAGNLWVADSANFRLQALSARGRVLLVHRADELWYRTTRRIYSPTDVFVGTDGAVWVADFAASRVQRFGARLE